MPQNKQTVVSFRVDQHLADILNGLPDKSAFIREAIMRRFYAICPFCNGRGVLPQTIAEWLKGKLPEYKSIECECCRYAYPTDLIPQSQESSGSAGFTCQHCTERNHSH